MVLDDIKQNINKIDSDLKNLFENVYITEKTNKSAFLVEISANKMFLFEGCKKRVEVKAFINKNDLKTNIIKWNYSLNPLNELSERIERVSYLNSFAKDVYDIAANKRMVKEYFNSLESHVDLILENVDNVEQSKTDLKLSKKFAKIMEVIKKYTNVNELNLNMSIKNSLLINANIGKESNKFNIERELLLIDGIKYVSFNNGIKITYDFSDTFNN